MSDLISRKEALKNYQSICEGVACTDCQMRYDDGECKLERFLRDAPTIEAEPRKHGRWIAVENGDDGDTKCSRCGCYHHVWEAYGYYCQHCGARMDEVEEDGSIEQRRYCAIKKTVVPDYDARTRL